MYSVRHAVGKGIGLFATTNVSRGTRLLAEQPLFTVESERDAFAAIRRLSATDRTWLDSLTASGKRHLSILGRVSTAWNVMRAGHLPNAIALAEYNTVVPIFQNNNFDLGSGVQAMFKEISRINHSCLPNSQGNFNTAIGKFTIHAIRKIAKDEEITISYLDEHMELRDSRQSQLRWRYGFDCNCPLCDLNLNTAREGEQRRLRMREKLNKNAQLAALTDRGSEKADLALLIDMIETFEEEQVAGRELATMYLDAAEKSSRLGDRSEACRYASLGVATDLCCSGADSPFYLESVARTRQNCL